MLRIGGGRFVVRGAWEPVIQLGSPCFEWREEDYRGSVRMSRKVGDV